MGDAAVFLVPAPLRCFGGIGNGSTFERCSFPPVLAIDRGTRPALLFCERCAPIGARLLTGDELVQRISFVAEIVLTGATLSDAGARSEALGVLERAVECAGGLLSLVSVTSAVGRYAVPAPVRARNASRDGG